MAFILIDRAQETATANTTVSFTLSGAMTSYQSFGAIGTGNTTYYGATDGTNWEVGLGTYTTSPNTLTRTTILSSSNSGSAVTFSGTVTVWCDYPAGKQISSDYPNALGVVTPAAGTFTTITGQTEVLKGTGQNLYLQSNSFTTTWTNQFVSSTVGQTDPFGGSLGWTVLADGSTNGHGLIQSLNPISGLTYTQSWYLKKGTNNYVQLRFGSAAGGQYANFDLNAGTAGTVGAGTGATPTSAITSIGNGWYRCTITAVSVATAAASCGIYIVSSASAVGAETNSLTTSVLAYGAQLEIGSVTNTYVPTTTTAVYGTPTLSFSGVAGLGLQSDGSLYVSPAGTGALQAQATTSSSVGGNARGANAVDWQTSRTSAGQVAAGPQSVIGGGLNNQSNSGFSTIAGGSNNLVASTGASILGGKSNQSSQDYSVSVAGQSNIAGGYFNFIGGGYTNSGTSSSTVTTQAAATNGVTSGSTAVTLAASNASIKVGQLITGTGIVSYTYVAAISGTSLTLSQNANATGTPTLSFYTPHGVVVGGGNNQATGSYSFIGGGGDAGTAANRNTASGDWSFVGGGIKNTASGASSFVGGGGTNGVGFVGGNTASGSASFIGSGYANQASAESSVIAGGDNNIANGYNSAILGGRHGTARGLGSVQVFPACYDPVSNSSGVSQASLLILGRQTTDATPTVLTSNSSAASTTNQVILPNNSAYFFRGEVISGVTGGGDTKGWTIEGVIKRGAGVGTTTLVGSTVTSLYADVGAATWTIALAADTTNGGLKVTFTGQASTTIRTVAQIRTTEMTY